LLVAVALGGVFDAPTPGDGVGDLVEQGLQDAGAAHFEELAVDVDLIHRFGFTGRNSKMIIFASATRVALGEKNLKKFPLVRKPI